MTLSWKTPLLNGGCSLLGFALYINDGNGGTTFTEIDSALIRNKPGYTLHTTTTFPAASIGNTFLFKLEAYNVIGSTMSPSVGFVLADVPATPGVAPTSDDSVTSINKVKIDIQSVANDGGSPIVSYSLEVDDGQGGNFIPVFGYLSNSMALSYTFTNNVERGKTFRARYRVRNAVGWGDYSPIGYILAA